MASSSSKRLVSFRLTRAQHAALLAWAARKSPDAVPSEHEAAKVIVLQRLVGDGVMTENGEVAVRTVKPARKPITGRSLRSAREARALTQQQLSEVFNIPRATLAKWETGAKRVPARLASIVLKWMESGEAPDELELERRERPTAWTYLLADKLIGDDE